MLGLDAACERRPVVACEQIDRKPELIGYWRRRLLCAPRVSGVQVIDLARDEQVREKTAQRSDASLARDAEVRIPARGRLRLGVTNKHDYRRARPAAEPINPGAGGKQKQQRKEQRRKQRPATHAIQRFRHARVIVTNGGPSHAAGPERAQLCAPCGISRWSICSRKPQPVERLCRAHREPVAYANDEERW